MNDRMKIKEDDTSACLAAHPPAVLHQRTVLKFFQLSDVSFSDLLLPTIHNTHPSILSTIQYTSVRPVIPLITVHYDYILAAIQSVLTRSDNKFSVAASQKISAFKELLRLKW